MARLLARTGLVEGTPINDESGWIIDDPTMTQGSDATGDVYYRAASGKLTRLATTADGHVLTSTGVGAVPAWEAGTSASSWVNFAGGNVDGVADLNGVRASNNISSVVDRGTGTYTVNIDVDLSHADYAVVAGCGGSTTGSTTPEDRACSVGPTQAAGTYMIHTHNFTGANYDVGWIFAVTFDANKD